MNDRRDPQELGTAILTLKQRMKCSILEAADMLDGDGLITIGRNSPEAAPAKIQPPALAPDVAPQERQNGQKTV